MSYQPLNDQGDDRASEEGDPEKPVVSHAKLPFLTLNRSFVRFDQVHAAIDCCSTMILLIVQSARPVFSAMDR
ncbi:MAG: hypothetical protein AB8B40_07155 [Prochlorococcus sp.]